MALSLVVQHQRRRYSLSLEPTCTVAELRRRIEGITGIPDNRQRLCAKGVASFSGSDDCVAALGLEDGAKLLVFGSAPEPSIEARSGTTAAAAPSICIDDAGDAQIVGMDSSGIAYSCTYDLGPVRQHVYVCRTCSTPDQPAGICLGCLKLCHKGHDIEELFVRRGFRCDCGTSRMPTSRCSLGTDKAAEPSNSYDEAFRGLHCHCAQPWNPEDPDAPPMIQCYVCDKWIHDRCTGLPSLPDDEDDYLFFCRHCVARHPFLLRYGSCASAPVPTGSATPSAPPPSGTLAPSETGARSASPPMRAEQDVIIQASLGQWCKCDDCLVLYEKHGLSFIFKEERNEEMTHFCVSNPDCLEDDDDDDDEVNDPQVLPQEHLMRCVTQLAPELLAQPAEQARLASTLRTMVETLGDVFASIPHGGVFGMAQAQEFASALKRKREEEEAAAEFL